MTNETDRIQNAIRHIQTSVDIDPWAMEIAVKAMTKQMEDLKNSPTQMSGTSDLISRQAAYSALVKHEESDGQHNYSMFRSVVSECEEIILDLPPAQPGQQWIPCSERLPEVGKEVLVCYDFKGYRSVYIANFYGDGEFHGYDDEYLTPEGRKHRKAVAWMPLPEPYRENKK